MIKMRMGVDNGLGGAISIISDDKTKIIKKIKMPVIGKGRKKYDIRAIEDFLKEYKDVQICVLEKAQPRYRDGSKQAFMTGYGYGVIESLLIVLRIPYIIVTPKTWQKQIFKGIDCADKKQASILYCTRKYPNEDFTPTERARKIDHNLTDATCIAGYDE